MRMQTTNAFATIIGAAVREPVFPLDQAHLHRWVRLSVLLVGG